MRPIPEELAELRRQAAASYRWKHRGRSLSAAEHDALDPDEKRKCAWGPDTAAVDRLADAERSFTATFAPVAATRTDPGASLGAPHLSERSCD